MSFSHFTFFRIFPRENPHHPAHSTLQVGMCWATSRGLMNIFPCSLAPRLDSAMLFTSNNGYYLYFIVYCLPSLWLHPSILHRFSSCIDTGDQMNHNERECFAPEDKPANGKGILRQEKLFLHKFSLFALRCFSKFKECFCVSDPMLEDEGFVF